MTGELVVRHFGQVPVQLLDHDLRRWLAQRAFQFGDNAWRRDKHEPIEFPVLEVAGERVSNRCGSKSSLAASCRSRRGSTAERPGVALSITRAGRSRPSHACSCADRWTRSSTACGRRLPRRARQTARGRRRRSRTRAWASSILLLLGRRHAPDESDNRHERRAAGPSLSAEEEPIMARRIEEIDHDQQRVHRDIMKRCTKKFSFSYR